MVDGPMTRSIEVLFSPAEFSALAGRDLSRTTCVVLDILRATTSMMTALANGAEAIIPVGEIPEAVAIKQQHPDVLLAGERNGLRICADQTGGVEFDFGNSPREFLPEKVRGKTIVMTTTNGTRALRVCAQAESVLIGSFLNLRATINWIRRELPANLILVCSGTIDQAALEDTLAAGALCERLWPHYASGQVADSAEIARRIYPLLQTDLPGAMKHSRNGQRLLNHPELRGDVHFCVQRETLGFVAGLQKDGTVRKLACETPASSSDTSGMDAPPSA
ncbi:MAG: 2-phosphosulfolactate phosphatase [Verrucomicrobia bacterium]|nr:MAG: 2-phosphosulfolactate phosphatase [Verrucomicrobiota bacterium]